MAHFELLEDKLLGEGAYGKVYRCRWYGSPAAAKQFNVFGTDETVAMTREIEMIKELRNDYIIQFFGTAHHNDKLCLITSLAENGSLRSALAKDTLSKEQKRSIITGLIRGMHYLKGNNVVHRDLKSLNVLLGPSFIPKICDFGLALLKLNSATHTKTSPSAVGTVRWMAPELLRRRPNYSFASDVYALGLVIWEIFTMKIPYEDIFDNDVIINLIKAGEHEDIPESIPEHYKSIIKDCWHVEPKDRISVEKINKANETHLGMDITLDDGVFDVSDSVQRLRIDSGHTASRQQSTNFSLSVRDITKEQEMTIYTGALDHYLQETSSISDSKDRLASVLVKLGNNFVQWIERAANQGNNAAVTVLGEMHYHGCGVPQDYKAAYIQLSKAAMKGMFDQGNARAQSNLGVMYQKGLGVPQSDNKAVEWYTKAAEQGYASAQHNLGWMFENGRGVPQSDDKAVEWFTKAAEQGYATAQNNLGWMYECGRGVPQSDDKAVEWYTKAAEQGDADAQFNLGVMYENGRGVPQSDDKAVEWYTKAAEQGHAGAQNKLGLMYQEGRGLQRSDDKAVEWITKAAEQGDSDAQYNLGWMYHLGRGVPQSDNKAVEWYTKTAEQGNEIAQFNLGTMYENGQGAPQSDEKAVEWYTKAAEQGYASAQHNLGWMYQNGFGVPQSDDKAVEWYRKAAEQGDASAQYDLRQLKKKSGGLKQKKIFRNLFN